MKNPICCQIKCNQTSLINLSHHKLPCKSQPFNHSHILTGPYHKTNSRGRGSTNGRKRRHEPRPPAPTKLRHLTNSCINTRLPFFSHFIELNYKVQKKFECQTL